MIDKSFDLSEPLAAAIRQLLFKEWDPCGIGLNDDCIDEYDDYLPAIYSMAKGGYLPNGIAAQLNFFIHPSGRAERKKTMEVAEMIYAVAEAMRQKSRLRAG